MSPQRLLNRLAGLTVCLTFMLLPAHGQGTHGIVREGLTIDSAILGKPVRYTVYLPADYETSTRYYPVVYLLHGYTDDDTGWLQFGEANRIVDAGIASGELPPMILVMPDGGVSWYINDYQGKVRWEDMFVEEFMPAIEAAYRIRRKKEFRGVAGLSMGGYGTLVLSMRHPDLFGAAAAFSAAVQTDEQMTAMPQARYDAVYGILYGEGREGDARLTDHWRAYSVLDLVRNTPAETLKQVDYYIDCGDDDFLTIGNASLHILMTEKEVPHEFRMRDGVHSWNYWRTGLPDGLAFIGQKFHR